MKTIFYEWLAYRQYPQKIWASEIITLLNEIGISEKGIIDAPCGNGIISYWLLMNKIKTQFFLYDISEERCAIAKKIIKKYDKDNRVKVESKNIYELEKFEQKNIWLLINSLYLLDDLDNLLHIIRDTANSEYVIGIFPYLNKRNYECLKKADPSIEGININTMTANETIDFFSANGYELCKKKDITCIPIYCYARNPFVQIILSPFFNLLDRFLRNNNGYYWVASFKRI